MRTPRIGSAPPLPYVDSSVWSQIDTVTLTQTYAYDSRTSWPSPPPVPGSGNDGYYTITGTATFTWKRASLVSYLQSPDLLFSGWETADISVAPTEYCAVQSACGRMTGWQVRFGVQPDLKGAFTQTNFPPTNSDGTPSSTPPTTTPIDASGSLYAVCAPCAPDRFFGFWSLATNYSLGVGNQFVSVMGINSGSYPDGGHPNDQTDVGVQLLQAGVPADTSTKQPEIGAVYRLTIPTDACYLGPLTIGINGQTLTEYTVADGWVQFQLAGMVQNALGEAGLGLVPIFPRSPWEIDVQMPHASDVFSSASLSNYTGAKHADSTVYYGGSRGGDTLNDPFDLAGQSFTDDSAQQSQGFTATLQF